MRWWTVTTERLWANELRGLQGQWVLIFMRAQTPPALLGQTAMPGVSLTGRVMTVDDSMVRLIQMGNELLVPLSEIWYLLKPSPSQQENLTLSCMTLASTLPKEN